MRDPQMRKPGKLAGKPFPKRNHEPKRSTRNFRHRVTLTDYLRDPDAPAMFSSSHRRSKAHLWKCAPLRGFGGGVKGWDFAKS